MSGLVQAFSNLAFFRKPEPLMCFLEIFLCFVSFPIRDFWLMMLDWLSSNSPSTDAEEPQHPTVPPGKLH